MNVSIYDEPVNIIIYKVSNIEWQPHHAMWSNLVVLLVTAGNHNNKNSRCCKCNSYRWLSNHKDYHFYSYYISVNFCLQVYRLFFV